MSDMLKDPIFFYAIALAIFLALVWWKGRKPILAWLDGEILKISDELKQVQELRLEAEKMLAEGKAKQAAAMVEAESIVHHAKSEADRLRLQTDADLKIRLAKQEQLIADRIRIAEAEAINMVRIAAIDASMRIARETLQSQMDEAVAAKLVDQVLANMPVVTKVKAKAA
jgi:F-type H+-transporting ATPase subunit b